MAATPACAPVPAAHAPAPWPALPFSQIQKDGLRLYALNDGALRGCAAAPDQHLQHALSVAAWQLLRAGPQATFTLALHAPAKQQGLPAEQQGQQGAAAGGSQDSSGGGSSGFQVSGTMDELRMLILSLSWLVEHAAGEGGSGARPWIPTNGRIRVRRHSGSGGGHWPLGWALGSQRGAVAGQGDAAGRDAAWYELGEWPADAAGQAAAGTAPRAVALLSQRQLDSLLDCLDAFTMQHPGLVSLPPLEPLEGPAPTWRQRLADRLTRSARAGGGGSTSGGNAEPTEAGTYV